MFCNSGSLLNNWSHKKQTLLLQNMFLQIMYYMYADKTLWQCSGLKARRPMATVTGNALQGINNQKKSIVICLSKIRDRDWSYTCHMICTNNHLTSTAVKSTGQYYQQLIFGPNTILGTSIIYSALRNLDFVSCDVTVVSSLKRFISRFLLPFVYLKEFQNTKII